jgi:prolyl oligopeptidase
MSMVVDTLHGVGVPDPYRWLEDQNSTEVRDWIATQERYADSVLGPGTPLRREVRTRLEELMDTPNAGAPRKAGDWEYFTLRRPGDAVAAIYRRRAPKDPTPIDPSAVYEKVIDPLSIRNDGTTSVGIEGFSSDGRVMMYSVRDGGPDEISVRFRNLGREADLPDSLPWALYSSLNLDPKGGGVHYVLRSREKGPRYKYHRFGTPLTADSVLYGEGLAPTAFLNVSNANGGRFRLYTIGHGWARHQVFVQDLQKPGSPPTDISQGLTAHFAPQFIDGTLWMRTDHEAPKGRIVTVNLTDPRPTAWKTIVPEGEDVLDSFSLIDGELFVTYVHDVAHRVQRFTLAGEAKGELAVPPMSTITVRGAGKGFVLMTATSFTQPSVTYRVNLATGERTEWEPARPTFDASGIEVTQVWYTSKDGTRAPMYLMYKRGMPRNRETPALLHGYGGFVLNLMPRFDVRAVLWVERGGIYAQATLRGGNEFGEAWHKDGMLTNKQNVFDDFTSAGQYLVDSGYTSPRRLAIRGGSNGGLLMGSALTQRPELFRAAFVGVPDVDMVRFFTFTTHNNLPALLEYGDASIPEHFQAIRRYSPYQNVKDGTRYPAVMVQTGINDTRVPPWQGRKFAARLQDATRSGLPVILLHDLRSGHAGGRSASGNVDLAAKEMEFLLRMVGDS